MLNRKICIVTGGAGHLGSAITHALAKAGALVYALGRDQEKLASLAGINREFESPRVFPVSLDVADASAFKFKIDSIVAEQNKIDCLINNANAAGRENWEQLDKKAWLAGFEGTLNHFFTCTQAVFPHMKRANAGSIINTGSIFSFLAPQFPMHLDLNNAAAAHHSAAKGAALQLTKHLAAEWGKFNIRVNMVSPGYFPRKRGPERLDYMKEITVRIPMQRIGKPEEVAGAFVFLASEQASYITGHNLVVDGGYSIW